MNTAKQVVFKLDETENTVKGVFICRPEDIPTLAEVDAYYRERCGDDSRDKYLRELAAEYNERCDAFDSMIAPQGRPRNARDHRAMTLHAMAVREQLYKRIPNYERLTFRYFITERADQ